MTTSDIQIVAEAIDETIEFDPAFSYPVIANLKEIAQAAIQAVLSLPAQRAKDEEIERLREALEHCDRALAFYESRAGIKGWPEYEEQISPTTQCGMGLRARVARRVYVKQALNTPAQEGE